MIDLLNALVVLSNYVLIPALAYGSQLALGALGVTLIYGILRFSNFAHGDTMAFGAMVTILVTWLFQGWGISLGPLPTALLAIPFRHRRHGGTVADHRSAGLSVLPTTKSGAGDIGHRLHGSDVCDERFGALHHWTE
jgi:hypothetical protein